LFAALLTFAYVAPQFVCAEDAEHKEWTVSFDEAKKLAAEQGKDILMEFTGSDWCPPCKALHAKVLTQEVFLTEVPKSYILLKLDSPRDKSKQTEEEIAQYKKLSAEYKVSGVPSVFLADAEGKPYVKMVGYGGQDAETYVKQVLEKPPIRKQRDEFLAKANTAEGVEKAKLLDQAISQIDSALALDVYADTVKEIVELDADDAAQLKTKYESKLRVAELKNRLASIQRSGRGNPEGALQEISALIDELKPEGEALQEVLYAKGVILFGSNKDESKKALEAALKIAPDSQLGKRLEQIIKANFK
jgi:thioredoxin-related protein